MNECVCCQDDALNKNMSLMTQPTSYSIQQILRSRTGYEDWVVCWLGLREPWRGLEDAPSLGPLWGGREESADGWWISAPVEGTGQAKERARGDWDRLWGEPHGRSQLLGPQEPWGNLHFIPSTCERQRWQSEKAATFLEQGQLLFSVRWHTPLWAHTLPPADCSPRLLITHTHTLTRVHTHAHTHTNNQDSLSEKADLCGGPLISALADLDRGALGQVERPVSFLSSSQWRSQSQALPAKMPEGSSESSAPGSSAAGPPGKGGHALFLITSSSSSGTSGALQCQN